MVCPSCGADIDSTTTCCSCGARWVGAPPTEGIQPVPRLVYGITALLILGMAVAVQLVITIRSIYLSDLRWPWELFLMTSYLSKFILPVVIGAALLAWRGMRLAAHRPAAYGGMKMSRRCLVASLVVCLMNGGVLLGRLPDMLENRRLKQQAYTRAMMYKVNEAIARYRQQYGSYPERLIDLQEMDPTIRPTLDYWDHPLVYTPMSAVIASRGSPVPFQNYQLISRGPDGILGTTDDIVMRDGVITPPGSTDERPGKPADPFKR